MNKTVTACCLLVLVPLGWLAAQEGSPRDKAAPAPARGQEATKPPMAITPEREAAVMKFVELNHPELKDVLRSLQAVRPKEYEKAIRDIYASSERLANLKARDPDLYELELEHWTLRSRIQLLAARMAMAPSDEIRSNLRDLLDKQMDVRAALLRHEQQRVRQRLEQIEKNLAKVESDREQQVQRQLELLMRSAESSKAKTRLTGKAEAKRPGGRKNKATVNQPGETKVKP